MTKLDDALYYTDRLEVTRDRIRPLLRKMHDDIGGINLADLYLLRAYLDDNAAYVDILHESLHKEEPKKTLRQKITRK